MFYTNQIVNPSRVLTQSDIGLGTRPIGLSLDNFLDLFNDVHAFTVSCTALSVNAIPISFNIINVQEGLNALSQAAGASNFASIAGETRRGISPTGRVLSNGEPLPTSVAPSVLINYYPVHSMGGGFSGRVLIDFGRVLFLDGNLYPFIEIEFSNGMGNNTVGSTVGTIRFGDYGEIAIFAGVNEAALGFTNVGGSIEIAKRYSDLIATNTLFTFGDQITLATTKPNSKWANYTKAIIGSSVVDVAATSRNLTLTAPAINYSGPIWFESSANGYDGFNSLQEFRIS